MYLYERLLKDALATTTLRELGVEIGLPKQTINDWLVIDKKPHLKSLEKVAAWADLPLTAMLIDVDDFGPEQSIIRTMQKLTPDQKLQVALYMGHLIANPAVS